MRYLRAEHLTLRHSMFNRLLVIAPLCAAGFAFLAGGFIGIQYMGLYWWYSFLLQGTIAILCVLSVQKEERAGKYYGVFSLPLQLGRYEMARTLVVAEKLIVSGLVLAVLLSIPHVLSPQLVVFSVGKMLVGSSLIILTSLWQIPWCFLLLRKCGMVVTVAANTLIGLFTIATIGNSAFWWIWPYCWSAKLTEYWMGIGINGVWQESLQQKNGSVPLILVAALLFFALLTVLEARAFVRKGGEGR